MTLRPQSQARKRSGVLVLDAAARQLRRGPHVIAVSGLPLRILELLFAADGAVVSREELKARLWPYATRIDVDRRLNTAIRALRKALEDEAPEAGRVLTVRGHGYRWVAHRRRPRAALGYTALSGAAALAAVVSLSAPGGEIPAPSTSQAREIAMAADGRLSSHWDWRGAETLYRRALAADPDLPEGNRGIAWLYVNEGRTSDALPYIARLLEQPDRTPARRAELGWLLMRAGKPDAALAVCAKPDEHTLNLLSCRHTALAQLGLIAEARDTAADVMRTAGADAAEVRRVSEVPPAAGYDRFLRWRVDHFAQPRRDWFQRAQLQAEAGMYAEALRSLEVAAARHDPQLVKIGSTKAFAMLQSSSRFRRIEQQVLRGQQPATA